MCRPAAPGRRRPGSSTPLKISPLKTAAPDRVVQLDVVGRARVLVHEGDRERLAGRARQARSTNATPLAVGRHVRRRGRRPAAAGRRTADAPDRRRADAGAARRRRARRAGFPPAAGRAGREHARLEDAAPRVRMSAPRGGATASRGAGPLSRWPVVSASTVRRYSWTASVSQPTRVAMRAMTPTASSQPPKTRPRNSRNTPERTEERPPRRPGHVDAGRWPLVDRRPAASAGRPDVLVVDAQALGQPVQQRQDERDGAQDQRQPAEHEPEEQEERADRGEDRGERRAGHVDAGRASRLGCAACPRRAGGAFTSRRKTPTAG